jgi:hypothetical protein
MKDFLNKIRTCEKDNSKKIYYLIFLLFGIVLGILSKWLDTTDNNVYSSRKCGLAGSGSSGVDPWCFAASGPTSEMATASAAGAVASVKSAFDYMTNDQVFTLLALTADGPFLSGNTGGKTLRQYLQDMYDLPYQYESVVDSLTDEQYMAVFKDIFGYGLINLERAITPDKSVSYYSSGNIVSSSGNAYWGTARAATSLHASSVFNLAGRGAINASYYDVIESADGTLSLPRVWNNTFSFDSASKHGLYMGDVLGELKTRRDESQDAKVGDMAFHLARSARAYDDGMGGLDELRLSFDLGAFHVVADYQRHLTDGTSRFAGMHNPVLALVSNAITSGASYDMGNWSLGARAFSGAITNDGLLENDPTLSAVFMPATLGWVSGAQSSIAWNNDKFGFNTSFGMMHETDTVLGAQSDGLFGLGAGDTQYVDAELRFAPMDNVVLKLRGTYARTDAAADGLMVADVSAIESNAFAFGADIGNFSFAVSQPLAACRGAMKYSYADYAVVYNGDGTYGIDVVDSRLRSLQFGSRTRELRFNAEYRHNFGEFTDGALGFIYRVNPNNTDEFGNESIFMLKMTHRVGI